MILDEIFNNDVLWQMSYAEKASVLYLLGKMEKRSVAIEIGSYKGGFLRVLSQHFDKVYSCDIDHSPIDKGQFTNVEWIEGDSIKTLPKLIQQINDNGEDVNFILIDGDHSYETVLQDIHNVLLYQPKSEVILLIHDSWYEPSREAVNKANWNNSPYVHLVEKDFVTGDLIGSDAGNFYVGGLALAYMTPLERQGDITINQTQDYMYSITKQLLGEER